MRQVSNCAGRRTAVTECNQQVRRQAGKRTGEVAGNCARMRRSIQYHEYILVTASSAFWVQGLGGHDQSGRTLEQPACDGFFMRVFRLAR